MTDPFDGAWLVTEYVHDPDGRFVGIVRQRRTLEPVASGRVRVTQICESDESLAGHPMQSFTGEWVFELTADGTLRRYLGPDVVGYGTEWSEGAMTAQGLWPRFGCTFESYAVLLTPERQLTGGFFAIAGRSVADIVGVAVPDRDSWPTLDLAAPAPRLRGEGPGVQRRVGPLAIAEAWPSATERVRTLGLADSTTQKSVILVDRQWPQERRVDVSILD